MNTNQHQLLWGAATSSHQVEGGCDNDWTEWEKNNALQLAQKAKTQWGQQREQRFPAMSTPENYISGLAADHYHNYKEDIALAAQLGHTAHRFSIEWSRVEPQKGEYDQVAIDHYKEVVQTIRQHGMEPIVTLWHFTLPQWIAQRGGWIWRRAPHHFERFTETMVDSLGDGVHYWITINEPMIYATNTMLRGIWPPQRRNPLAYVKLLYRLREAHKRAWTAIHNRYPNAKVGIAKNCIYFDNKRGGQNMITAIADWWWNQWWLNGTKKEMDYIGVNYYFHNRISGWAVGNSKKNNNPVSDMGWEIYPEGLYQVLMSMSKYGVPLMITENGIADADDSQRAQFIKDHIEAMQRAQKDGVDVVGYLYWSLLDNIEWDKGVWPRFGLVAVDYATMKRTIRSSAWEYKKIIETQTQEKNR